MEEIKPIGLEPPSRETHIAVSNPANQPAKKCRFRLGKEITMKEDKPENIINFRQRRVPEKSELIGNCVAELKSSGQPINQAIEKLQREHPELDADDWRIIGQALIDDAGELERYMTREKVIDLYIGGWPTKEIASRAGCDEMSIERIIDDFKNRPTARK